LFTSTPRLKLLRERPGKPLKKETRALNWKTADLLESALPLEGEETIRATVSLATNISQSLPPVCLPYSPEFAPDKPSRGRKALGFISKSTGGRQRANPADIWSAIPRQPHFVPFSIWLVLAGLILFLLEVLQRRTGFFEFRKRTATQTETTLNQTDLQQRKSVTQTGIATGELEDKSFRLPKRKRRKKLAHSDDAPPVVAPPMLDSDAEDQPPVIPPKMSDSGDTFDALSEARKRAQDRRRD